MYTSGIMPLSSERCHDTSKSSIPSLNYANLHKYRVIKEVPLLSILTTTYPQTFPLSSCQCVSTVLEKKNCMLPTFEKLTFCKGLYGENDGLSI